MQGGLNILYCEQATEGGGYVGEEGRHYVSCYRVSLADFQVMKLHLVPCSPTILLGHC